MSAKNLVERLTHSQGAHNAMHAKLLDGAQWLHWRRTRWWWKPWTWFRPAGHFFDPRVPFAAHLDDHREQASLAP